MKSFLQWYNANIGKKTDLDNASYDCVDVPKSWAEYLYDKPWTQSLSWGNAKDIWNNVSSNFWQRIPRGTGTPKIGDVVCMGAGIGGGYGHIAVVVEVVGNTITVIQQDTFLQAAAYLGKFDANASYIQGYLRPVIDFDDGTKPEVLQSFQRKVGKDVMNYRQGAGTSFPLLVTDSNPDGQFSPGEVLDFKGYVHGQNIDGNDIWFVGMHSGGYIFSGGFEDTSTHDLADLTPKKLSPTERQIGGDPMNWRTAAQVAPDNVIRVLEAGKVLNITGYVQGFLVDGNNIWFRYEEGGSVGYVWSGGFADSGTHDLNDVTPANPGDPIPVQPTYPMPTNDPQVTQVYNKTHPVGDYAPTDLVNVGNGQTLRKEAADSFVLMKAQAPSLNPGSGYRTKEYQKTLYDDYVKRDGQEAADRYSARPGYSEHQTGLTMDFTPIDDAFKIGAAYKFLMENGYKYGWVLRYPADKENITGYMSEPWHWRYIGIDAATDMHNKGITTLEEYYSVVGGGYADPETPSNPPETPPPVPAPEAATSAAKFVARLGTQFATVAIVVQSATGWLRMYTGVSLDAATQGWITIIATVILIAALQFGYKVGSNFKWPF